jgi:hypothetical protein
MDEAEQQGMDEAERKRLFRRWRSQTKEMKSKAARRGVALTLAERAKSLVLFSATGLRVRGHQIELPPAPDPTESKISVPPERLRTLLHRVPRLGTRGRLARAYTHERGRRPSLHA